MDIYIYIRVGREPNSVHISVCISTYMHNTYICTYIHTVYIYIYIHVYIYIHIYIFTQTYTLTHAHTFENIAHLSPCLLGDLAQLGGSTCREVLRGEVHHRAWEAERDFPAAGGGCAAAEVRKHTNMKTLFRLQDNEPLLHKKASS